MPASVSARPVSRSGSLTTSGTRAAIPAKSVEPVAPYTNASPYSSVADPTEPMIRYLSPDSSDVARRISVAHSTYSGIDSSSSPRNSDTRFVAATSTNMPAAEVSISA